MPQMGESITEGTLIKWHKRKGESVKKDEIIYEIATDKVDTEIPSPEDGVLADINAFYRYTSNSICLSHPLAFQYHSRPSG